MKAAQIAIAACLVLRSAGAYEPDVTQQREEYDRPIRKVDHLIPSGTMPPEAYGPPLHYLARFIRSPPFHEQVAYEWALTRSQRHATAHRYVLSSWRLDRSDRNTEPRRIDVREVEIPQQMAATIYSIWANAILDARYARQAPGVDGISYWFSTSLRGVGWFSATTWGPDKDVPPGWLVEAGEQVLAFSHAEHPDEDQMQANLDALQRRLREHASK